MACVPRGCRSNGDPAGRPNGELKGDEPFIYDRDPQQVGKAIPRGQAATSSRRATRKTKVRPSLSSSTRLPRDPLGVRASPAKAVCSSFPEGNGDLNREWCVYALKFWENATMTGACLVGIAWRAVYMETREVAIGAAMMSSPGPRANIGHIKATPARRHISIALLHDLPFTSPFPIPSRGHLRWAKKRAR
ncbi:hypothetical protein V2G26_001163 [Clonostachys chloroleuca]